MSFLTTKQSSILHSGIKNILQDFLEDVLKTQRRMSASSAPRGLKFCTELPFIYVIPDIQSHLHSIQVSRMPSTPPWRKLWILIGECPLPLNLEVWHFARCSLNVYIYHSWHPKSSRFYSGIKNVLQIHSLETHRIFSSSNSPRNLKFCKELRKGLYMLFLIHKVHFQLESLEDAKKCCCT